MSIAETLEYIHSVKWRGSKPGLERTRELLKALGTPEKSLKFVHIAGTNGKGSTAACIAAVLKEAGYRVGLYTSPYVTRFNERMQVDGEHISDDELIRLTNEIRPFADAMGDPPTEFEMITALAMKHFLISACDIVVLEAGMGGQLDSTNVIDVPEVAIITAIGYDHVKELGPTLSDIAGAKAGIIKNGGDVVIYGGDPEADTVFERVSAQCNAKLRRTDFTRITQKRFSLDGAVFDFAPYGRIAIPLAGTYQPDNAAVAITALELLREKGYRINDVDIIKGLAMVRWPGRFEVLMRGPVFILDGAHNPQGAKAAADSLRSHFGERKVVFIIGVMEDKDIEAIMSHITPLAAALIAVRPDNPRAMDAGMLTGKLVSRGVPVFAHDSMTGAVTQAIGLAGKRGIICALGSLFMSADIRAAVQVNKAQAHKTA